MPIANVHECIWIVTAGIYGSYSSSNGANDKPLALRRTQFPWRQPWVPSHLGDRCYSCCKPLSDGSCKVMCLDCDMDALSLGRILNGNSDVYNLLITLFLEAKSLSFSKGLILELNSCVRNQNMCLVCKGFADAEEISGIAIIAHQEMVASAAISSCSHESMWEAR